MKEAEANAAEDKKKQELIEARNAADNLIYATEKSMKDLGDKLEAATKDAIQEKTSALRKVMEGDDAEAIKKATEELSTAAHSLAEKLYAQQAQQQQQAGGAQQPGGNAGAGSKKGDDDVVDAEFTDVK